MSRRLPRPGDTAPAWRRRVAATARPLLLESEPARVSLAAVARMLGCSRTRIYQAYGSREALVAHVATAEWRALGHLLRVAAPSSSGPSGGVTACWQAAARWERQAPGRARLCFSPLALEGLPREITTGFLQARTSALDALQVAVGTELDAVDVWALFAGWLHVSAEDPEQLERGPESILRALRAP